MASRPHLLSVYNKVYYRLFVVFVLPFFFFSLSFIRKTSGYSSAGIKTNIIRAGLTLTAEVGKEATLV